MAVRSAGYIGSLFADSTVRNTANCHLTFCAKVLTLSSEQKEKAALKDVGRTLDEYALQEEIFPGFVDGFGSLL